MPYHAIRIYDVLEDFGLLPNEIRCLHLNQDCQYYGVSVSTPEYEPSLNTFCIRMNEALSPIGMCIKSIMRESGDDEKKLILVIGNV